MPTERWGISNSTGSKMAVSTYDRAKFEIKPIMYHVFSIPNQLLTGRAF
ncbi:MAG: hypothetical protein ACLFQV_04195 [Vulcanimicrobiota bacterium]